MKYAALFCLILLVSCSSIHKKEQERRQVNWIEFNWVEAEISGKKYPKAAIEIPVLLNDFNDKLSMQFDIGSQHSFLNGNSIRGLQELDKKLSEIDTLRYDKTNFDLVLKSANISTVNGIELLGSVFYKSNKGEKYDPKDDERVKIGTIGADILQGRILVIDYPNHKLAILDSLPSVFVADYVETTQTYGKINIPVEINGVTKHLLFDTGASIFEVATTPVGYKFLNGDQVVTDSLQVPSFGALLDFIGSQSENFLKLGDQIVKKPFVYYSENVNVIGFFEESEVFGLTGNALFLENTIIVDYRSNQFGILK